MKARLQPWFVVVVLASVAMAAWFQASAVTAWLGGRLALDEESLAAGKDGVPRAAPISALLPTWHVSSAEAIVARNPFDSVTGPLNRPAPTAEPELVAPALTNPYLAAECPVDTKVAVIAAAADPVASVVVLASQQTGGVKRLFRMGDPVGEQRVWYITWDRVWLRTGADLCQAKMFRDPKSAAAPPPPPKAVAAPKGGPPSVVNEIKARIQRVSATEFNVDRSVIDTILENQGQLMRSARIIPERENGKTVGIRLMRVTPDSLLGTIGLENGDRLETINGFDITSPEKALEAYARLRTAGHISVAVNRRGKPVTIEYRIR